jgi:5'-3' exoribonuclease 2
MAIHDSTIETLILNSVVENIKSYIRFISPKQSVYITFDGVAPFAKMSQQRTRRYKSDFTNNLEKTTKLWNTTAITPGTEFMNSLSKRINSEFLNKECDFNLKTILISCSDEPGEGEHKVFKYIRENDFKTDNIAVYGLDSDLIMLSICHLQYLKQIFVFREAPEFKSVMHEDVKDPNEKLFLDINLLASSIFSEMGSTNSTKIIHDYIFICFFLGNDFLPHHPCLNIRTHGTQTIIDNYRDIIGKYDNRSLVSITDWKIQWEWVKLFLARLAKKEHELLLNEYSIRNKMDSRTWAENTDAEKELLLLNLPIIYRQDEKYISPNEDGWEKRYYRQLFNVEPFEQNIKNICINYLEGLEWVFKYYSKGCPDWKWKYNYSYPPLLKDLMKYVPGKNEELIKEHVLNKPFHPFLQLSYVLPYSQHKLLPIKIADFLKSNFITYYPKKYGLKWAFCRYFWEAHPEIPEIGVEMLENWDSCFPNMIG